MLQKTPLSLVYLSVAELGISERERAGLIEVRDDLASGRVKHAPSLKGLYVHEVGGGWGDLLFNMAQYHSQSECGTAHCIAGFMQAQGVYDRIKPLHDQTSKSLKDLFQPRALKTIVWFDLTTDQAVSACDHFLAGAGAECWPMALSDIPV